MQDVVVLCRGGWKSVNVGMGKVASSQVSKRFAWSFLWCNCMRRRIGRSYQTFKSGSATLWKACRWRCQDPRNKPWQLVGQIVNRTSWIDDEMVAGGLWVRAVTGTSQRNRSVDAKR